MKRKAKLITTGLLGLSLLAPINNSKISDFLNNKPAYAQTI